MLRKALYFIDKLIHKVIPHPPCEKLHIIGANYITTTGTSTINGTNYTWTYKT